MKVPALALVGVTHFNFSVYAYFATSMLLQMVPALPLFLSASPESLAQLSELDSKQRNHLKPRVLVSR